MGTVDIRQQELDFAEQQILNDIFGGYTSDEFVYRYGFFKIDLAPRVQKIVNDFENFVRPMMDEDGYIDSSAIKKYINEQAINIPDGKYRLVELYRKYQPYLITLLNYIRS